MKDKYLSVITNFGCHYSCPYCIVKKNNLNIPKTTIEGLDRLEDAISENNVNWVSVSGGGDPLWEYENHKDWWKCFFQQIPIAVRLELHTSILDVDEGLKGNFDRIVYHLHSFEQLKHVKRSEAGELVRVVFVVTEDFTENLIDQIADYCEKSKEIDELSFRQMVDDHYESTNHCVDYLRTGHKKKWWYIEQRDYNLYYCENKLYTEYRKIGVTDNSL